MVCVGLINSLGVSKFSPRQASHPFSISRLAIILQLSRSTRTNFPHVFMRKWGTFVVPTKFWGWAHLFQKPWLQLSHKLGNLIFLHVGHVLRNKLLLCIAPQMLNTKQSILWTLITLAQFRQKQRVVNQVLLDINNTFPRSCSKFSSFPVLQYLQLSKV